MKNSLAVVMFTFMFSMYVITARTAILYCTNCITSALPHIGTQTREKTVIFGNLI